MSRAPSKKKLAEIEDYRQTWERDREALRPYYKAIGQEYDYCLKLDHHKPVQSTRNGVVQTKDVLQVSTLDVYDANRYATGELAGSVPYLDARPLAPAQGEAEQKQLDQTSEIVRSVMLQQVGDVDGGYPGVRRDMIRLADAARAGAVFLDVVPGGEKGARIIPRLADPRNLSWDTRYKHFTTFGNQYLMERVERVPLDEIEATYGKKVQPDNGTERVEMPATQAEPRVDRTGAQPSATLVVVWEMGNEEEVGVRRTKKLDPSNFYMACTTCDYTERDLMESPDYDGSLLPESEPCPKCGVSDEGQPLGTMTRMETERVDESKPVYKDRNRRCVFAPYTPEAGYLEDGDWPEGLTHFPAAMYVPDPFPLEPFGNSRTFLGMDMQSLKNATLADYFMQMQRNRDLMIAKEDSLWTAEHEPYQFDGTGDYIAYCSTYDDLHGIQHFQGAGLNRNAGEFWGILDGEVGKNRGIGQVSGQPEELKGVNVGTIARANETGDVPLDEMLRILRECEEGLFNRWLELLLANTTTAWWVDVAGFAGASVMRLFDPTRVPRMRIRVHASPKMDAAAMEQAKALKELRDLGSPTLMRFFGHQAHMPPSLVEEVIREVAAAQPVGAGVPGMPPGPPGLPPLPGGNGVPPALGEISSANGLALQGV